MIVKARAGRQHGRKKLGPERLQVRKLGGARRRWIRGKVAAKAGARRQWGAEKLGPEPRESAGQKTVRSQEAVDQGKGDSESQSQETVEPEVRQKTSGRKQKLQEKARVEVGEREVLAVRGSREPRWGLEATEQLG